MVGIVLLGIFVILLVFGAPIAICLGMSSVAAILVQGAGKPIEAIKSVLRGGYFRTAHQSGGKVPGPHQGRHGHRVRGGKLLLCGHLRLRPRHRGRPGPDYDPRHD